MTRVRGRTLPDGRRCKYSVPSPSTGVRNYFRLPDYQALRTNQQRRNPADSYQIGVSVLGWALPFRLAVAGWSRLVCSCHCTALRLAWYARYYSLQKARRGKSQHSWSTTHFNTAFAAPFSPTAVAAEASHLYRDHIFTLLRLVARRVILGRCERHQ